MKIEIGGKYILDDSKEYLLLRKIEDGGSTYAALVTTSKPNTFVFTKVSQTKNGLYFIPVSDEEKLDVLWLFQN